MIAELIRPGPAGSPTVEAAAAVLVAADYPVLLAPTGHVWAWSEDGLWPLPVAPQAQRVVAELPAGWPAWEPAEHSA